MARPLREEVENGVFHVYARGNAKQAIYLDDLDRQTYLRLFGRVVEKRHWRCLAYCLMANHVHLVLQTPDANLAVGMQALHGLYAQTFNERHDRVGHLFQGRYGAVRIRGDSQLWTALRYLALNPVEAGLCTRPAEWRWGSYGVVRDHAPDWLDRVRLLELVGGNGRDPWRRYVEFVDGSAH
jgi:putative transposase